MANQEQVTRLSRSIEAWNQWREHHLTEDIDLNGANLNGANLNGANLRKAELRKAELIGANLFGAKLYDANLFGANLSKANLSGTKLFGVNLIGANLSEANLNGANLNGANLSKANFNGANLIGANLSEADLNGANLIGANLSEADLNGANLSRTNLSEANLLGANLIGANLRKAYFFGADLSEANLNRTLLVETNFNNAILKNCTIYGISAWNVSLKGTQQENLTISDYDEPQITVDNLEVAQFIYLLLNNEKIRNVINTLTTKAVLILGRFTLERKVVLEALREELRKKNYLPILFDFEKPNERNLTETVKTLAHLARFIIADLTEPSSIPHELQAIIPTLAVPVRPILLEGKREYAMFPDFSLYSWVLPIWHYRDQNDLLATLKNQIIEPAEQKAQELEQRKMGK